MQKKFYNKITIIGGGILAICLMSILTVVILKKIAPNQQPSSVSNASEIIKSYKISDLDNDDYRLQLNALSALKYKLDSETFGISILTNKTVLTSTTAASKSKDTDSIQAQTKDFMTKKGLKLTELDIYNPNKSLKYKTYVSANIICQLTSNDTDKPDEHFHQLACIDKKDIVSNYDSIKKLLAIDKTPKMPSGVIQTSLTTDTKDNIKYSILSINSNTASKNLLHASVDDKWEYLGDLIGGGKKYATEKTSITPELLAKINDPKYKSFIADNVIEKSTAKK